MEHGNGCVKLGFLVQKLNHFFAFHLVPYAVCIYSDDDLLTESKRDAKLCCVSCRYGAV
jgi:hypothetical protein